MIPLVRKRRLNINCFILAYHAQDTEVYFENIFKIFINIKNCVVFANCVCL